MVYRNCLDCPNINTSGAKHTGRRVEHVSAELCIKRHLGRIVIERGTRQVPVQLRGNSTIRNHLGKSASGVKQQRGCAIFPGTCPPIGKGKNNVKAKNERNTADECNLKE